MTMIADYYAHVGIKFDSASVTRVTTALDSIKTKLKSLEKDFSVKNRTINFKIGLDYAKSLSTVNAQLNRIGRTSSLNISNIRFSKTALNRAFSEALMTGKQQGLFVNRIRFSKLAITKAMKESLGAGNNLKFRLGAKLSMESLRAMRAQIRQHINSLVVSPTINPRVRRSVAPPYTQTVRERHVDTSRRRSPNYNPMMIGGSTGAFLRYGMYALPFVAGTMGVNSLSNSVESTQNAYMGLRAQVGDPIEAASQIGKIESIADRHGVTFKDIAPGYAQMYASAKGSELGENLDEGFLKFMQYASVKGLNSENKKGAILAFSQIIGKDFKAASEEINKQLVNQGMPEIRRLMADALGVKEDEFMRNIGDRKYDKNDLIKIFDEMGRRAAPYLPEFYETVTKRKGDVTRSGEVYLQEFMAGGGIKGITSFLETLNFMIRDSMPFAKNLGDLFYRASNLVQGIMLLPGEMLSWVKGLPGKDNIFESLFGSSKDGIMTPVLDTMRNIFNDFKKHLGDLPGLVGSLFTVVSTLLVPVLNLLVPIVSSLFDFINIAISYAAGKKDTAKWLVDRKMHLDNVADRHRIMNPTATPGQVSSVVREARDVWEKENPRPFEGTPDQMQEFGRNLAMEEARKKYPNATEREIEESAAEIHAKNIVENGYKEGSSSNLVTEAMGRVTGELSDVRVKNLVLGTVKKEFPNASPTEIVNMADTRYEIIRANQLAGISPRTSPYIGIDPTHQQRSVSEMLSNPLGTSFSIMGERLREMVFGPKPTDITPINTGVPNNSVMSTGNYLQQRTVQQDNNININFSGGITVTQDGQLLEQLGTDMQKRMEEESTKAILEVLAGGNSTSGGNYGGMGR